MALVGDEKLGSHHLRDFLSIRDDVRRSNLNQGTHSGGDGRRRHPSGLTLHAILSEKTSPPPPPPTHSAAAEQRVRSNRTLLDVIREERASGLGGGRGNWRQQLRARIRLINNRSGGGVGGSVSAGFEPTQPGPSVDRRFEDVDEESVGVGEGDGATTEEPVRMSLMALLAETDRQMGVEGSAFVAHDDGVSDAAAEESFPGGASCCVCMVRGKGAAFIPCGHTFCRVCSRELLAQRGNCPLCNNHILEILDLF